MAELLGRGDIDTALAALPGWSVADDMDHHPEVSRRADAVIFRLWTHSAGGVTAKDVDLAGRIDRQLSGGGTDTGG